MTDDIASSRSYLTQAEVDALFTVPTTTGWIHPPSARRRRRANWGAGGQWLIARHGKTTCITQVPVNGTSQINAPLGLTWRVSGR